MSSRPSHREGSRKRKHDDPSTNAPSTSTLPELCQGCDKVSVETPMSSFHLNCSGRHVICAVCFSSTVSTCFADIHIKCPVCHESCSSWHCQYTSFRQTRNSRIPEQKYSKHRLPKPSVMSNPLHYHQRHSGASEFATLTLSRYDKSKEMLRINSLVLPFGDDADCNECDGQTLTDLEDIGRFLHTFLITHDKRRSPSKGSIAATGRDTREPTVTGIRSTAMLDYSPLHRFVFSMAYGRYLGEFNLFNPEANGSGDNRQDDVVHSKLVCQTWVISDIMRHMRSRVPGSVKTFVTAHLQAQNVSKGVYTFLNNIGITTSYQTLRRKSYKDTATTLEQGSEKIRKLDPHSVPQGLFDNVGYKKGGGFGDRVGYLSLTMLMTAMIPKEKLVKWGIYDHPSRPENVPLRSRVSKQWIDERAKEEVDFDKVMAPTSKDYNCVAKPILSIIDTILGMVAAGKMMSYDEAAVLLSHNMYEWIHEMPDPITVQRPIPEDDDHSPKTHFEVNEAVVENPMEEDLSKKNTCKLIANYLGKVKEQMLKAPRALGWQDVEPIAKTIPVILACDGQPAAQLQRMITAEEIVGRQTLVAGFHLGLSGYKALGKLFAHSHLRDFFGCWRRTEGQLKWVMEPGDPNQVEDEMIMLITGILTDAVIQFIYAKKKEIEKGVEFKVCATDVVDHIMARSKEWPMVNTVTLMFPIVSMLLMLQSAEEAADWEAFHSIMKVLVNVCASAHQTGYVYLVTRYFVNWFCASEAEREIQARGYLFKKTKNGRNIFCDRWVEWTVRYLRQSTGKKATSSKYATVVQRACLFLNERCRIKLEESKKPTVVDTEDGRNGLKLDKVFQESLWYSKHLNLWGNGAPRHVPSKPLRDRMGSEHEWPEAIRDELKSPSGKEMLNDDIFFWRSIGESRIRRYFEKYELKGDFTQSKRSEDKEQGVPLTCLEACGAKARSSRQTQIMKWVSTDKEYLEKDGVIKKDELKEDIKYLNQLLEESDRIKPRSTANKPEVLEAVIALRTKVISKYGDTWIATRKLNKAPDIRIASLETRGEELNHPIYTFEGTEARAEYQKEEYKHTFKGEKGTDQSQSQPDDDPFSQPSQFSQSTQGALTTSSSPSTGILRRRNLKFKGGNFSDYRNNRF